MADLTARPGARLIASLVSCVLLSGALAMQVQAAPGSSPLQDVALQKPATQSSTEYGGDPGRAVDGNTNGDHFAGSVTHTSNGPGEWWQVDLGASFDIREIVLWNRTDCCSERLHDVLVLVSDTPFPSGAVSGPTGWSTTIGGPAGRETRIPVGIKGRYVRVQHTVADYLSLAEVEVWGAPIPTPSVATGAWTLVAGSPRNEITDNAVNPNWNDAFGGGAGSASISIDVQGPSPDDPHAIRSSSFTWTQPPSTLVPGARVPMSLSISGLADNGIGFYASGLFARFTQPGQPCGIVRDGDIDVGVASLGSLIGTPPAGAFTFSAPATGFSGPATSQRMQLQVCADIMPSRSSFYYEYEWKPAAAGPPSSPKAPPTVTSPTQAKLVVQVTVPGDVPVGSGGAQDVINYVIKLTNEGNAPAAAPSISWTASFGSPMPLAVEIVRVSSGWTCRSTDGDNHPGSADCSGGTLAPGETATLEVTLDAPPDIDVIRASVAAGAACGATGRCGDSWHGVTTVGGGGGKLQVTVTSPAQVNGGEPVRYDVVVTNVGTAPAADVFFEWIYPDGTISGPVGWVCQPRSLCGLGALEAGTSVAITIASQAPSRAMGTAPEELSGHARVTGGCGGEQRCAADGFSKTIVVFPANPLKLSVSVPADVRAGQRVSQPITIVVRVKNDGTGPATIEEVYLNATADDSALNFELWDLAPTSAHGFDCAPASDVIDHDLECHGQLTIAPGHTARFTFTTTLYLQSKVNDTSSTFSLDASVEATCMPNEDGCPAQDHATTNIVFMRK